ncbi:MAG: aminotransferase class I/II-fold pyridoxal phosphate-dependent enzyme [Pirellula sp.]|jgi:histidinol-phosphate aminotransferase|nr:aminotransferase class I/II-fold pyridoxal phosphate-dependent enzyme [Pirellula sp.]
MNNEGINRRRLLGALAGTSALAGTAAWTCLNAPTAHGRCFANWESERIPAATELPTDAPIRILLNENPLGCSPKATAAAIEAVSRAHYYPFDLSVKLANQLRRKHNMPLMPEPVGLSSKISPSEDSHVLTLAGGSSELLFGIAHAFTSEGGGIIEADPSYQALGAFALKRPHTKAYVKRVPLLPDGDADLDGMLKAIDSDTKVVVINNPNNPTGTAIETARLIDFLEKIPEQVIAVVDEAYIDFLDTPEQRSVIPLALRSKNIVVTRTFSKIHGLAGLRVGYAIGPRIVIEQMQNYRVGSFSLNQCGLAAAMASLEDTEFQILSRGVAKESRLRITECLKEHGFKVARSDAACVWAESDSSILPLVEKLAQRGILIASGLRWERPNCLRISVATVAQTTKLIESMDEILSV